MFSEADQRLYALDPASCLCWLCLSEPDPHCAAVAAMRQAAGLDEAASAARFQACLEQFRALALLDDRIHPSAPAPKVPAIAAPPTVTPASVETGVLHYSLPGLNVALTVPDDLAPLLTSMLSPLRTAGPRSPSVRIVIERDPDGLAIRYGRTTLQAGSAAGLATSLENLLVNLAVRQTPHLLALHAASVSRDGTGLMLAGPSGAGKSTLTVALLHGGWRYGTDELLLLTGERVIPIPIAPCIKDGSFAMVERWFPALADEPIHERYGRRVRYLPLSRPAASPDAIRSVVFPTWQPAAAPVLRPLSGLEGLTRLLSHCIHAPRGLDAAGVDAILEWHRPLSYHALAYADPLDAVRLIEAIG